MKPFPGNEPQIHGAWTNCLSTAHKVENCGTPATCRVCLHHSLLHHGPTSNPVAGSATIPGYDNSKGYALQTCRAVTDAGSQVNLIWRRMANLLSLKDMSSPIEISGIGGKPQQQLDQDWSSHYVHQGLKHPDFRQPGPIDLTLGVDEYSRVITGELLRLRPNKHTRDRA